MRIGELSKLSGVAVETIRFYENEGLIPKAARSMNNYRSYTESHLKRLQFIRHCRSLDMSLEDIKLLSDVGARRNEEACKVQEIISRHMKKIDEQIAPTFGAIVAVLSWQSRQWRTLRHY